MTQSPIPAERYHLAIPVIHVLPSLTGTNSASATFYLSRLSSAPHMPLPTLRTSRYRDARKTRFRSATAAPDKTFT